MPPKKKEPRHTFVMSHPVFFLPWWNDSLPDWRLMYLTLLLISPTTGIGVFSNDALLDMSGLDTDLDLTNALNGLAKLDAITFESTMDGDTPVIVVWLHDALAISQFSVKNPVQRRAVQNATEVLLAERPQMQAAIKARYPDWFRRSRDKLDWPRTRGARTRT